MLIKSQKESLVKSLSQKIAESKSAVFVNYRGLTVADTSDLKKHLRENNASYTVVKKRLIERAAKSAKIDVNVKDLDGQVALALSMEDEVSAARVINDFSKKNDKIQILGGILEGVEIDSEKVKTLARLPSKPELLAKLVGTIQGPLSGLVNVLQGNTRGLVQVLKAIGEQKS